MPIELRNVTYSYSRGSLPAVRGVSLDIADGEYIGIMGAADSGQTTLLELMAGVIKPTEGTVTLDGEDINAKKYDKAQLRTAVGYLMHRPERRIFETTVERDVGFVLRGMGLNRVEQTERIKAALTLAGLDYNTIADKSPFALPLDVQRRVALAGVLCADARILLLDEPFAGLDYPAKQELISLLTSLNAQGKTIITVTQEADALAENAGRIGIMRAGELVRIGRTRDIFSDYYDLLNNGVTAPSVRLLVQLLREKGVDMPGNVITCEQLLDRLKIIMWRKMK